MRDFTLVGREVELEHLRRALDDARAGRGGAVFLTGEPGIGRTRLITETLELARHAGMAAARGRSATIGPPAGCYRPLIEAVLSMARHGWIPPGEAQTPFGTDPTSFLIAQGTAGDSPAPPVLVAEALMRVLSTVGRDQGCLVALDDLHAADAHTLAAIEYLLDNLGSVPAVLLLSAQTEPGPAQDLCVQARQHRTATVLDLPVLTRHDVHATVADRLGVASDDVDPALVERLLDDTAGVPLLLHELIGELREVPDDDQRPQPAPTAATRRIRRNTARLVGPGHAVLCTAALLGTRFPFSVLERATGCSSQELSAVLRAGVELHLLRPDSEQPTWYRFRHRLARQTFLDELTPTERGDRARCAADALVAEAATLAVEWGNRAAELRELADDVVGAAELYRATAERALAQDAVPTALTALLRATQLPRHRLPAADRAGDLERTLHLAADSGRADLLAELTEQGHDLADRDLPRPLVAALTARLAGLAQVAGQTPEADRLLGSARRLLDGGPESVADPCGAAVVVDLVDARLQLCRPSPAHPQAAVELAERARDTARRADLPPLFAEALLLSGRLTGSAEVESRVTQAQAARRIAEECRLPTVRVGAELLLAQVSARRDGGIADLHRVRQRAVAVAEPVLTHAAAWSLVLTHLQRGEFSAAREVLGATPGDPALPGPDGTTPPLLLLEAALEAHQGSRGRMARALERVTPRGWLVPGARAASFGLAQGVCALLEEDRAGAERALALAHRHARDTPACTDIPGQGLHLLLEVLAGRADRHQLEAADPEVLTGARWDRYFSALAEAVLLGRESRRQDALAAAAVARETGQVYPVARHLGLRLVARSAHEAGWGEPVEWLREAEEFFHRSGLVTAAGGCRGELRRLGVPMRYRCSGTEQVTPELRRAGVTVREFEVSRLIVERLGNTDIARRLHISPRTVEKHVASLLRKTGHDDRSSFAAANRCPAG